MSKLSNLAHLGGGKETTMGVAVAPTFFPPYTGDPSVEDIINPEVDESVRANDSLVQGVYGGVASSTFGFGGRPHADTLGHLLRAIIGPDTLGGGVNGLTGHTFKSNNTQPPSYTWTDFDTVEARAYPGCMETELKVTIDAMGAVMYDTNWLGWPSTAVSTPVPGTTSLQPLIGWQLAWSAGGVASTRVLKTDFTIKREIDIIASSDGTQSPRESFAGPIEMDATASILFEDTTDRARFLTYAQTAVVCSLIQPAGIGGARLDLTCSKAVWHQAKVNRSSKYAMLDVSIKGVYNTTDAGPVQAFLNSPVTTVF